ncbi:MAG: DUF1592 domain-containing protein [Bryobacterales bacterium]|nr:DUF1592 domain-containing protein [Bryobacterales bacterium]
MKPKTTRRGWIGGITLLLAVSVAIAPTLADEATPDSPHAVAFREHVTPFVKRNCLMCHNQANPTAGISFSGFATAAEALTNPELWEKAAERLTNGTMPPKGLPRPPAEQQKAVLAWIHGGLEELARNAKPDPGRVTARRLNRFEYNNTVRDLLGIDFEPAKDFPADDSGYGFDNIGDVLTVSPILMEKYVDAAWEIAQRAIVSPTDKLQPTTARLDGEAVQRLGTRAAQAAGSLAHPSAKQAWFEFPADAEYEVMVRMADRRKDRASPGRFAAAIGELAPIQMEMETSPPDDEAANEYTFSLRVPAGKHAIRAMTVDAAGTPFRYLDPADATRFIDVSYFEVRGPFDARERAINDSHKRLIVCAPATPAEEPACAERVLRRLARLAYRRPVDDHDLRPLLDLAEKARAAGLRFEEQMRLSLQGVLVSPHFLFRIERDLRDAKAAPSRSLSPFELASRLSYFLWSSMPDETLLQAAEEGRLSTREQVMAQVDRMLGDPRASALTQAFAGQWLQLRNMDHVQPDRDLFPDFDAPLRRAMKRESELFFEAVLNEKRGLAEFLVADFTFLNERLARHYGISGVEGEEFRRVSLAGTRRSGILTHGSVLTISSYPTRTSPVLRGLWLLENVLGAPPPPPPPDIPELNAEGVGEAATLRERMELHRSDPTCAACHSKMDPLGFSLENFDAIGRFRSMEGKFPIDAAGVLPNGAAFDGPDTMKQALLNETPEIARSVAGKMLTFALGRGLERYDRAAVDAIVAGIEKENYPLRKLVEEICWSMPFRMRREEGGDRP